MAVGEVMHDLAHGPAAVAIGRVKLGVAQALDCGAQALGEKTQSLDMRGAEIGGVGGRGVETPDGVAEIIQFCHGRIPGMRRGRNQDRTQPASNMAG